MKQWKSCQFMSIHVSSCWFMVSCCTMRIMWIMWIKWIMWMLKIFDMICALWMHNVKARFSLATMRYDSTRLEDSNQGNLGNLGMGPVLTTQNSPTRPQDRQASRSCHRSPRLIPPPMVVPLMAEMEILGNLIISWGSKNGRSSGSEPMEVR